MKIVLCTPPSDDSYVDPHSHFFLPSLGIMSLKSYLDSRGYSTFYVDGNFESLQAIEEIIAKERPDFVGVSSMLVSHENSLRILSYAKDSGASTIIGGHNATYLANNIIKNNAFIDYVVLGDGEFALSRIVNGDNPTTINNICYRDEEGEPVMNSRVNLQLASLPNVDYSGIDMGDYIKKNQEIATKANIKNYQRLYSHKGCINRSQSVRCFFCGRADEGVRFKSPHQYLEELLYLQEELGADYVFDVGDDFLANYGWLKNVSDLRKGEFSNLNIRLGCFGRANRVNPTISKLLKEVGVTELFLGFESGDSEVTRRLCKNNPQLNLTASRYLFEEGLDACAMYVVGLPGENDNSLINTVKNAKDFISMSKKYPGVNEATVYASVIEPYPGSPAFRKIIDHFPGKYNSSDRLSLYELQEDLCRSLFNTREGAETHRLLKRFAEVQDEINSL